jgi:hypothetical protein
VLRQSVTSTVHLTANSAPFVIGTDVGGTFSFGGLIDEVAVFGTALSATRIAAHYAARTAGGSSDTTPPTVVLTQPANDSSTTDTTPTFSGTAGTFSGDASTVTVKIYSGQTATGTPVQTLTTQRDPNGAFSVTPGSPLAYVTYTAQAEQGDDAGNTGRSSANTFLIVAPSGSDPVLVGAGDIAYCDDVGDEATAALLDQFPSATVFTIGDNAYEYGTPAEFANCYGPTWGRAKLRTRPALGDHDYADGADGAASGYFGYFGSILAPFGSSATDPSRGWYSYDIGTWHVAVLNSECDLATVPCTVSQQVAWLQADLAAHPTACTMAVIGAPRFSSGSIHGPNTGMQPYWQALYDAGAELVLSGDDHLYERFAPQTPSGTLDNVRGIRQFVVGTGGRSHYPFANKIQPNSEVRNDNTFGIIKLTLRASSYEWQFVPEAGKTFTDAGTQQCH